MKQVIVQAEVRTQWGKGESRELRRSGKIPAVFYGRGLENLHLSVIPADLEKAVAGDLGMNTLIQLKIGGRGDYNVLLRDYQADPIRREFRHADFVNVDLTKKIQISVPINLTGRAAGVKEGGILDQVTRELVVLCLPTNIPRKIDVDVSPLKIGQNLHLSDIKFPEGVEPREKTDVTIASVVAQREEEAAPTPATMVEPEVLTAKKTEGEEGKEGAKEGTKEAAPAKAAAGKAPAKAAPAKGK